MGPEVVDEVEHQAGRIRTIAHAVQPLQHPDTRIADAAIALPIDVILEIARQ